MLLFLSSRLRPSRLYRKQGTSIMLLVERGQSDGTEYSPKPREAKMEPCSAKTARMSSLLAIHNIDKLPPSI